MQRRIALPFALTLALLAAPALASEASDAYKEAKALQTAVDRAKDEESEAQAKTALLEFCKGRSDALAAQKLSKMDMLYLSYLQSWAGLHDEAVATAKKAIADPAETKYGANIHVGLVDALIAKGDIEGAMAAVADMKSKHEGHKLTKTAMLNVGLAAREAGKLEESARALEMLLAEGETSAAKILVNDYLVLGQKDKAVAAAQRAVEAAKGPEAEDMARLLAFTRKHGEALPLSFAAYLPEPPETQGKVVVMGFWNLSARTAPWTFKLLESLHRRYSRNDVVTLGVTTYYKKDPDSGQMDEAMTAEREHEIAGRVRDPANGGYTGTIAYTKDEAGLHDLGLTGLPYFVVLDRQGRLAFFHLLDYRSQADRDMLRKAIDDAVGK